MNTNCPICESKSTSKNIKVRSKKGMEIRVCSSCNFHFFPFDPSASLADNNLDKTRLAAAGLEIPDIKEDYANGLIQSQPYVKDYFEPSDKGKNILEIGCSWGYFLDLAKQHGSIPYGIELNSIRVHYVNSQLGIKCFPNLEDCEKSNVKFKKIYMFYVLEYVPEPKKYLQRLINLLEEGGSIIMITPNLDDTLKDIYGNQAFYEFFYDEHAINYFTPTAVHNLIKEIRVSKSIVSTKQGYSFINHINWFLNNKPRTSGRVGGDYFISDILKLLSSSNTKLGIELSELITRFDNEYKKIIEDSNFGNQIECIISK